MASSLTASPQLLLSQQNPDGLKRTTVKRILIPLLVSATSLNF
jgi:hypothetical protein